MAVISTQSGGNEEVARLSGINVLVKKIQIYSLSGFFAGLSGVIMLSRLNSGQPATSEGFEMDVITAAVLGGVSVAGGRQNHQRRRRRADYGYAQQRHDADES